MNPSLGRFRESFQELLLDFLWRQWSALGVAGYADSDDPWAIDPEALLLLTCSMGRHEARMFDEVLDWMDVNGRFINVQRLRTILRKEKFSGERVLPAIAGLMSKRAAMLKWRRLAQEADTDRDRESLFFLKSGEPMPMVGQPDEYFQRYGLLRGKLEFRGHSQPVRTALKTNIIYKLRALFGVNARCEILLYLLTHESAHPSRIARETYYYQKTVQDTLVDMTCSGLIQVRSTGREKHYWLRPEIWSDLLMKGESFPEWVNWPPLFSALERIWLKLNRPELYKLDPLLQSSELRQLMRDVRPDIERAGFARTLTDDRGYLGEDYTSVFLSDITNLLE